MAPETGKPGDSAAPEEAAGLLQVVQSLELGAPGGGVSLAAQSLMARPGSWVSRAALRGLPLALVATPFVFLEPAGPLALLLPALLGAVLALIPAGGLSRHRRLLAGQEPAPGEEPAAVLALVPALGAHLLVALGGLAMVAVLPVTMPLGLVLGAFLVFSWTHTLGEGALLARSGQEALVRGPTRAAGYLRRLPGRVLASLREGRVPRGLLAAVSLWSGLFLAGAVLAAAVGNLLLGLVLAVLPDLAPAWVLEGLVLATLWAYLGTLVLALDAGSVFFGVSYLEHQVAVESLPRGVPLAEEEERSVLPAPSESQVPSGTSSWQDPC